ncbi:hypothetical protein NB311A_05403 [Nitrobacter sp. Nb-311A]|nr:hypothetical protein NB311A_05403 [Nitrobacter sp. Nb-311A]
MKTSYLSGEATCWVNAVSGMLGRAAGWGRPMVANYYGLDYSDDGRGCGLR